MLAVLVHRRTATMAVMAVPLALRCSVCLRFALRLSFTDHLLFLRMQSLRMGTLTTVCLRLGIHPICY